jgi:hypothetical protein
MWRLLLLTSLQDPCWVWGLLAQRLCLQLLLLLPSSCCLQLLLPSLGR